MSEYTDYLARESEKERKAQALDGAARLGAQENPDAYAKVLALAARTGIAPDAVKDGLPEVEAADRVKQMNLAGLLQDAPATAEWMSDPHHAAIAHDDTQALRGIETAAGRARQAEESRVSTANKRKGLDGVMGYLQSAGANLSGGVGSLLSLVDDTSKTINDATIGRFFGPSASEFSSWVGRLGPTGLANWALGSAGKFVSTSAKPFKRETQRMFIEDPITKKEFFNPSSVNPMKATAWEGASNLLLNEAPSMAAMALLTSTTGGGAAPAAAAKYGKFLGTGVKLAKYAMRPAALVEVGRTIQGQRQNGIEELMAKGASREQAEIEVAPGAILAGALSFGFAAPMEAKILEDLLHKVSKAPGGATFAKRALARLGSAMTNAGKEGLQEVVNGIGEDTAAWLTYNPDKTFREAAQNAAENFFGGAVMGGAMGGAMHRQNYSQEFFQSLADGATDSKLLKRMPEKFQEAVHSMVKDGPVENVRISPDAFQTYFQSKGMDPAAVAQDLGVSNYMEAQLSGNDILIPTAAYATQLAGSEHHAELSQDLKLFEGELSAREQSSAAKAGEQIAAMTQEVDSEAQAQPEFQQIRDELKARYVAAGESPAVAETYAMDGAKVFTNMAHRAGMTPGELFAQYAPKIVRGQAPDVQEVMREAFTEETFPAEGVAWQDGGDVFFQSAYHGSPYRFDKFSLEHMGKGEGAQAYGHGLYFAGNKEVAEFYRAGLTLKQAADEISDRLSSIVKERAKYEAGEYGKFNDPKGYELTNEYNQLMERREKIRKGEIKLGQTYQVDIPDDGAYLLWDKPLGEQPEAVQDAFKKLRFWSKTGTGADAYRKISDAYGSDAAASKALNDAGLPGIKFLDGSSRSGNFGYKVKFKNGQYSGRAFSTEAEAQSAIDAGDFNNVAGIEKVEEPSYNYVIFDDNAVQITKTFYQSQQDDFSFGSKKWQEHYKTVLGKNARAKGDRAARASEAMRASLTPEGQAQFDFEQNAALKAEEEAFLRFDTAVARIQRPRGWFTRNADGTFVVGKTPEGDFSTFIHEPAHAYLGMFEDLAKREGASDQLKSDWAKTLEFLGNTGEPITTEQHEKWARANEAYAREGKAPSQELRGVFQRFKIWLQAVYRHVQELDVELNDDIRGVFDRMRATDEEIDLAHAEVAGPQLFTSAEQAGWTEKQFQAYANEKGMEVEQAKAEVLAKLNEAAVREKSSEWKAEEREVRAAVTALVDDQPEFRAIRVLRKGALEDGTPLTLNRQALVDQFGEERVAALHKQHINVYRNEGMMDAEAAAEFLGFPSGDALMTALESTGKRSAAIDAETQRVMVERHGDIRYDGTIQDQARQAVANDTRSKALHRELDALRKKAGKAESDKAEGKQQARSAMDLPPLQTFREAARSMVESRAILNLDPNSYLNGQRKYSREAYRNMGKGKFQEAADAKQKELINHFMYLEAVKAKARAEKIANYAKGLEGAKAQGRIGKAQGSYLEQINGLLDRFDFRKRTNIELEQRQETLAQFVMALPEGADAIFDPALLDERYRKNYREMTITELEAVHDALKNIETLARADRRMIVDGQEVEFETAIKEMTQSAYENNKAKALPVDESLVGPGAKIRTALQGLDAGLKKVEWLIDHLDGGKLNGPWRRYIFNPIAQAQYKARDLHERVGAKLIQAMEEMPNRLRLLDAFDIPGIGRVSRKYIITMALNMGNESNAEKMAKGMGWAGDVMGSPQVDAALSKLTAADWEFVQKVWDSIEGLWPDIVALEKRTTGVPPPKIQPRPMSVHTADGQTIQLRGGYFPVAYDSKQSSQGAKQEAGPVERLFDNGFFKAITGRGHTKERVDFAAPLIMDFERVVTRHLAGVIQDLSHREAAMAINKLLMDQNVRTAVQETMGTEYEAMLLPWLRGVVNDAHGVDGMGRWDKLALTLRSNVVLAGLGFRISSVAVQATDWVRAMDRVKPRHLGAAVLKFSTNPAEMIREVRGLSKEMAGRPENLDRDLKHQWERLKGEHGASAAIQRFAMQGLSMADAATSVTTWWGGYQQALESGLTKEEAIASADRDVRLTLMSGAAKDQVAMQRKKDIGYKMVTMFMGDSTSVYGILGDVQNKLAKGQDVPKQAARLLFSIMLPAVLAQIIKSRGPGDDEDEAWWATKTALMAFPSSVPVLRDVAQAIGTGRDPQFSPVAGGLAKLGKAVDADWKLATGDENQGAEDAFMHSLEAASVLFGLPIGQPLTTYKYARRVQKGEENPESNLELAKNLALGPPPKGKK